jgi:thiamine transport system substrate-binding protein
MKNNLKTPIILMTMMLMSTSSGCIFDNESLMTGEYSTDSGSCKGAQIGHNDDGKLRILTYDINAISDEMIEQFTNQSGFEVEIIRTDDAGGILEQMLQTKDAQQADLMIGLDNTYLQSAIDNCLLQYHSTEVENISIESLSQNDGDFAVPFDQGYVCINYDENYVDGENVTIPTSLWNLTEEQWIGKIAFPSPVTSSPGRAFMVSTIDYFENDEDNTTNAFDWWRQMRNNGAIFTSGWTESYEIHYTGGYGEWTDGHIGDAAMTISYCHSPGVEAYYSSNWTHSKSLILPKTSFHQIEYTGIINGAANVVGANQFIEYLLSAEVNSQMPEANLMYSVLNDTDLPETSGYRYHSEIPTQPCAITSERISEDMDQWLTMWVNEVEY